MGANERRKRKCGECERKEVEGAFVNAREGCFFLNLRGELRSKRDEEGKEIMI